MRNRWVILTAGILIQTVFGGIYAWSTFTPYLVGRYELSKGECGFIFGLTIAVFTVAMVFAGRILTIKGPRFTAGIGAVLFMGGYLAASMTNGSFPLLLISLGIVAGTGIGFGYVCPLSVGMKWFPKKKGLVTGAAVSGFGGGAVLLSSVAGYFLRTGTDVLEFFRWYGFIAGAVLLISALFLANPSVPREASKRCGMSAVFTLPFGIIMLGMFAGTFAGLLIIGNLTSLVIEAGLSERQAAISVAIFAIGNAIGRISWGHVSDRLGSTSIPLALGSFSLFCIFLQLPFSGGLLMLIVGLLGFGFGANFVVYASAIPRLFGTESFPQLYPICFLGYGVAGIIGPGLGGYLADLTGSYSTSLYISIAMVSAVCVLSRLMLVDPD